MKKIKYFLVLLVLGLLIPISNSFDNTYAFKLGSLQAGSASRSDIGSTFGKVCIQNNSFYQGYGTLIKQGYTFGSYGGSSTCINYAMGANSIFQEIYTNPIGDSSSHGYFYSSLVSFESDNQGGYNFKYYDINNNTTQTFNVPSIAGFTYTLTNGQNVLFDEVYFWHDTIIFMNSESHYTLQLIGTTLLENLVIYSDPFSSNENLYMIDFNLGKAWSTSLSSDYVASIMFNAIDISNTLLFSEIDWTNSYTLSAGSTSVFPLTAGNLCSGDGCKQSNGGYSSNMWSYNLDPNFVAPDYGGDNNQGYTDPIFIDDSASYQEQVNNYYSCVDLYSDYNVVANSFVLCRQDYINNRVSQNEYNSMINYVKSSEIIDDRSRTGYTTSETGINCTLLLENARSMAKRQFIDKDLILSDYITVITKLENSGTNPYDLNAMCGSKPTNAGTGVSSNDCNLSSWQNIVNCFGGGSQTTSGSDSSLFLSAVENIKIMVGNTFDNTFLDPIKDKFDEGYNYLTGGVSCTTESLEIPYINLLVYVMAMLIFFSLYKIL